MIFIPWKCTHKLSSISDDMRIRYSVIFVDHSLYNILKINNKYIWTQKCYDLSTNFIKFDIQWNKFLIYFLQFILLIIGYLFLLLLDDRLFTRFTLFYKNKTGNVYLNYTSFSKRIRSIWIAGYDSPIQNTTKKNICK